MVERMNRRSFNKIKIPNPQLRTVCVEKAFFKNYQDMRTANTIGGDKYFHCKANCEATRCSPTIGKQYAENISNVRKWFDHNIIGDSASACATDQAANFYGRNNAQNIGSCSQVCQPFRPNGLPMAY